ncbi:RNA 2',3'-cyclic phosphodiesterase [Streptomyces inusitatus]|uniref:RNA 2',3'-cyclic phosphodiesterase n=1 Tax=Streptomyces inusitatus TaxID=68221 RepID=A0A918QF04_9ACTN|nr:RNA 2',3'-cyclic phosphodiesterase [Streptomyces inusitatus]GGZ45348.1 RNA 2',3'-cyclic phosphodiesterase [Streptomyces inusitatus]
MRLFAAVLPPAGAVAELGAAVDRLRALPGSDTLRWTGREDWHYTLAFLGEVEERLLPELTARLARAARRTDPFALRIHGGGHFGGHTLWAGAAGALPELRLLAERTDAAARRAGVSLTEHRRYHAHLTIARSRTETDLGPYADGLSDFEGAPWPVSRFALVRSARPEPGVPGARPRYATVAGWHLGHRGPEGPG